MKKVVLLLQSLKGESFNMLKEHAKSLTNEDCVYLFHNFEPIAEMVGVRSNYETLKSILNIKGIPVKILKEYSLDEYFDNHSEGDIFITPTESTSVIISSASLLGYKGNIYVFGASKNEPQISNIAPYVRAFKYKDTIGVKGLNKTEVFHDHSKGKSCHYTIGGKKFTQIIKGKGGSTESGVQGYTMICEDFPEYRIKIWDSFSPKCQYEIDEVALMISNKLTHPSIAFPITFVYNENNEPIGFVMKNFKGRELDIREIRKMKNPLRIVEQMLKATIWMEANDLFHRDISHNMLVDEDGNISVIDVDSLQYKAFPATASESDPPNALPQKYFSNSLFYNTIDISYTAMAFLIASFFDVEKFFGVWGKDGFCPLNQNLLNKLRNEYPSVAKLVTTAYVDGKPVATARQLEVVQDVLKGEYGEKTEDDFYPDEYNGDYPTNNDTFCSDNGDYSVDDETYFDNDDHTYDCSSEETNENDDDFKNKPVKPKATQNTVIGIDGNEPNKHLYDLVWFFRKLILSMFSTGTKVQGMTLEDEWRELVRSRKWVKPFVSATLAVVLMIVMTVAIIIM